MPPLRTMSRNEKGQAWGAFWRLERIWNSNLPIAIKVCLYKCTVLSFLLYGSETWTLTESPCDKLNTFQRSCLRVMLGISRRDNVTNQSVYSQTQARPLSSEVKRQLRFPGHSLRRDKEDLINSPVSPVCTICRPKCWRDETFVFATHLEGHYGRLHSTDGARNTTRYRRPGLLETSACPPPGQSELTRRRAYIFRALQSPT